MLSDTPSPSNSAGPDLYVAAGVGIYARDFSNHSGANCKPCLSPEIVQTSVENLKAKMTTGLDEFHQHLREISKLAAWVLPTASFTPVVASLVGLNPPWPNRLGLTVATSAAVLFALVAVFQFLDGKKKREVHVAMSISLGIGVLVAVSYFSSFAVLVFDPPGGDPPFSKGLVCTSDALLIYASKCPWLDLDELKSAGYEESRLWTIQSIAAAKMLLLLGWFSMFVSFAVLLGAFVRHQAGRRVKSPNIDH